MKIAFLALKGLPMGGGIEKYTEEVGSRLAARGHEVVVYTMGHYGTKPGKYKGMTVKVIPTIKRKSLEKIIATLTSVLSLPRDVDIVHLHAFGPAMFSFIPRIMRKKVIVQGHGLEWKRSRWGSLGKLFLRITEIPSVLFPHTITVVSRVQQKYLEKTYGKKSEYIPTGVAPARFEKPDLITKKYGLQGNDYILFTARLVREKGAQYLIDAYNRLDTDKYLVIAGDAEHEDEFKSQLKDIAGGNRKIIFTGFVTGKLLRELFSNCYFFVLPSEIEGLPIALLEAMSYKNCCLVSDIEENIEALQDKGYTFRSMDTDDLYEKMLFLLDNWNAVYAKKKAAQDRVMEKYTWDIVVQQLEKQYCRMLNTQPKIEYIKIAEPELEPEPLKQRHIAPVVVTRKG